MAFGFGNPLKNFMFFLLILIGFAVLIPFVIGATAFFDSSLIFGAGITLIVLISAIGLWALFNSLLGR